METRIPIIKIERLNVTYFPGKSNEVHALTDISLEIFPGEYIIFFGPSGCGKSTLLYSIAGLERNVTGNIIVKNVNLSTMSQTELEEYHQRVLGMIFQQYYLISSLSIAENVSLPQVAIHEKKADRLQKAMKLLEQFGVLAQASKLPTELSGGQQQRVAICRSLINDPSILVADEPVGNLDSKSSKDVMNLLRYLNDEQKKTVILVTHDPSHLHHAHRIFYLRDGKIIGTKTNTPEERAQALEEQTTTPSTLATSMMHWIRTYTPEETKGEEGIIGSRAQQILAEVFTGMTTEELIHIEEKIRLLLKRGSQDHETIFAYLHSAIDRGGIGLPRERALEVSKEIKSLARKVKLIADRTKQEATSHITPEQEAEELRRYLLDHIDIHMPSEAAVHALDRMIRDRITGTIDQPKVLAALLLAENDGGVGLSTDDARLLALRIEPFVHAKATANVLSFNPQNSEFNPNPNPNPNPHSTDATP